MTVQKLEMGIEFINKKLYFTQKTEQALDKLQLIKKSFTNKIIWVIHPVSYVKYPLSWTEMS